MGNSAEVKSYPHLKVHKSPSGAGYSVVMESSENIFGEMRAVTPRLAFKLAQTIAREFWIPVRVAEDLRESIKDLISTLSCERCQAISPLELGVDEPKISESLSACPICNVEGSYVIDRLIQIDYPITFIKGTIQLTDEAAFVEKEQGGS